MVGKNKKTGKLLRVQSGNIHVCFRGNNRNVVFYDDNDIIQLLLRINRFAKQYDTKIIAFVIMQNHVHLQVITNNLTPFMRSLLNSYSRWYNQKYGMSDQVFKSPFLSSNKRSREWATKSVLYILNNPIKAGICTQPKDYLWSSYHFYFGRRNPLVRYIDVDKTFVEENIKNHVQLDSLIITDMLSEFEIHSNSLYDREIVQYSDILKSMLQILNGRKMFELNREECEKLIVVLRETTGASYRQIANVTHESWEFVRRVCVAR